MRCHYLRYQTLTYAVFQQMTGRSDNTAASILSLLLVGLALIILGHRTLVPPSQPVLPDHRPVPSPQRQRYGWLGTSLITGYLGLHRRSSLRTAGLSVDSSGVYLPKHRLRSTAASIGFFWNSGFLAACAATGGVLIGLPLAYLASRRPTWLNLGCLQAAYAGYVLPGPVAALAVLVLCLN